MPDQRLDGTSTEIEIARASFPLFLRSDVETVVRMLPEPTLPTALSGLQVNVRNEFLEPPDRIYRTELANDTLVVLPKEQRLIAHCIYTRHHDGYVRQRHVIGLLERNVTNWTIPYVLWLLGDYVREICQVIANRAETFDRGVVTQFANSNPEFMRRLRQQVLSYWSEYWRSSSELRNYPGYLALSNLGLWRGKEGAKVLRRERRAV